MSKFVFILDHDSELRSSLTSCLQSQGFEVAEDSDNEQGLARILQLNPGVVVLDEDIAPVDGVDLLPLLRRKVNTPVIILGNGKETDIVTWLFKGADMYVTRPADVQEVSSRVQALYRRTELTNGYGSAEVTSTSLEQLLPPGVDFSLTDTEARLFACLMDKCGRVVSHDELMTKVWGKPVKKERLRFYVHSLRKKISETTSFSLNTRNGIGYVLEKPTMLSCEGN